MDGAGEPDPLEHMQQRAAQCRRLAKSINDQTASNALRNMANEIEAQDRAIAESPHRRVILAYGLFKKKDKHNKQDVTRAEQYREAFLAREPR